MKKSQLETINIVLNGTTYTLEVVDNNEIKTIKKNAKTKEQLEKAEVLLVNQLRFAV